MDPVTSHTAAKALRHAVLDHGAAIAGGSEEQIKRAVENLRSARIELALRIRCLDHLLGHLWTPDKRCSCKPEEIAAAYADTPPDYVPQEND